MSAEHQMWSRAGATSPRQVAAAMLEAQFQQANRVSPAVAQVSKPSKCHAFSSNQRSSNLSECSFESRTVSVSSKNKICGSLTPGQERSPRSIGQASPRAPVMASKGDLDQVSQKGAFPPLSAPSDREASQPRSARSNGEQSSERSRSSIQEDFWMQDVLVQRMRVVVVDAFEKHIEKLHQRVTEAVAVQHESLLEKLSRSEEAQARHAKLAVNYSEGASAPTTVRAERPEAEPVPTVDSSDLQVLRDVDVKDSKVELFVESAAADALSYRSLTATYLPDSVPHATNVHDLKAGKPDNDTIGNGHSVKDLAGRAKQTIGISAHRQLDMVTSIGARARDIDKAVHEVDLAADGGRKAYCNALSRAVGPSWLKRFLTKTGDGIEWWEKLEEPARKGYVADLINHPCFEVMSMSVVLGDQMLTTWGVDYAIQHGTNELPLFAKVTGRVFAAFFVLELVLKLYIHRAYFFISSQWKMNLLDCFLVLYSFLEEVAMRLSFLRVLRMFKMAKIVRMLKALTAVHDLRIMLDCLLGSFFGLVWALVLIGVVIYIFALIFVQSLGEYLIEQGDNIDEETKAQSLQYFGSVLTGVLSVYEMLTGGRDWGDMYTLVRPTGPVAGPACILMIAFFTISVWNIITSVFIEKAMQLAQPTVREVARKHKAQAKIDAREVADLINRVEKDKSGLVTKDEFRQICANPEVQEFLSVRNLSIENVTNYDALFDIVYTSESGRCSTSGHEVSTQGVVKTFLNMKGGATSLDLQMKHFELLVAVRALQAEIEDVRKKLQRVDFTL